MKTLALIAGLTLLGAAVPAMAAPKASFDCAKARTATEKAICANPALAADDARIGARYSALRGQMDPVAAAGLKADQQDFLWLRDQTIEDQPDPNLGESRSTLAEVQRDRLAFLNAVEARPAPGLIGIWRNEYGEIEIKPEGHGLRVRATTVEQIAGRWVCDVDSLGRAKGDVLDIANVDDAPGWVLRLARTGVALTVTQRSPGDKPAGAPWCGLNGTLAGHYFRVPKSAAAK